MQNGITLIALVITIIVMLILAGVSINAIVGDDGILNRAVGAGFISEMTAVHEAFDMWQVNSNVGKIVDSTNSDYLPVESNLDTSISDKIQTLKAEIMYYREWMDEGSSTLTVDELMNGITTYYTEADESAFFYSSSTDVIDDDLYFLDNDELSLKKGKKYVIDAADGMIYSVNGAVINGVRVHSMAMFKAIQSRNIGDVILAELEGSNAHDKNAGNYQTEYLVDANGNYIDENGNIVSESNKVENPNYVAKGFRIIASPVSNNIYKLYNDGTLLGKGEKGIQLNTSVEKMNEISANKFSEFTVPSEIGAYKKIISGNSRIFVIDNNDYLWAWGSNANNLLGLTKEQQIEYTGRNAIKLNIGGNVSTGDLGKKVDNVWDTGFCVYVRTTDGLLYVMTNDIASDGNLSGLNNSKELLAFTKLDFEKVSKIDYIFSFSNGNTGRASIIACTDNTYYACGNSAKRFSGIETGGEYKVFTPILNGYSYDYNETTQKYDKSATYNANADIDQDIKKIMNSSNFSLYVLKKDNTLWNISAGIGQINGFEQNIKDIWNISYGALIQKTDNTFYGYSLYNDSLGLGKTASSFEQITLPSKLISTGIKEVFCGSAYIYYLANDGQLYGSSQEGVYTLSDAHVNGVIELKNTPKFKSLFSIDKGSHSTTSFISNAMIFEGMDNKMYQIGNASLTFRDEILEKSWVKINDSSIGIGKVKEMALGINGKIGIITDDKNLFIAGNDSRELGLGTNMQEKISNLVKLDDAKINGKVKSVQFKFGQTIILTTDGVLYSTGRFSNDGSSQSWPNGMYPGWAEKVDHYDLYQIATNVKMVHAHERECIYLTNDNKVFVWGNNFYGSYDSNTLTPRESDITTLLGESKVKKLYISLQLTMVLSADNKIIANGSGTAWYPASFSPRGFFDYSATWFGTDKVADFSASSNVVFYLMEDGSIWGHGQKSYLGMNVTETTDITRVPVKLQIGDGTKKVKQIITNNKGGFAILEDGSVWATGDNTYGVLGRWKGTKRNQPNSRYRTAFEWVECPELEI